MIDSAWQAAKLGNVRACVAVANHLDALGMREEGMVYRKSAARLGDARSQVCLASHQLESLTYLKPLCLSYSCALPPPLLLSPIHTRTSAPRVA